MAAVGRATVVEIFRPSIQAELVVALAAVATVAAALVVVNHHPVANPDFGHAGPQFSDFAARLVAWTDFHVRAFCGGLSIGVQITATHAGRPQSDQHVAGSRSHIRKLADFRFSVAQENYAFHVASLLNVL